MALLFLGSNQLTVFSLPTFNPHPLSGCLPLSRNPHSFSSEIGFECKGRSPRMETFCFRLFSDGKAGAALLGVLHDLRHTGTRANRGTFRKYPGKRNYDAVDRRKNRRQVSKWQLKLQPSVMYMFVVVTTGTFFAQRLDYIDHTESHGSC